MAVLPPIISPNQPKHCTEFQPRTYGCHERVFQASWFEKFPWLHYDKGFDVARCYICYRQHEKSTLNSCRNQEDAFIKTGYSNWKNALENFRKHKKSLCHMTAIAFESGSKETSGNVAELISMNAQTMAVNRQCLLQIIECCRVLARQNIAFQGATEVDSNFFQILKFKASDCPDLREWLSNKKDKYISHDIQNEICSIMANHLLHDLVKDISPNFFSLYSVTSTLIYQIRNN